MEDIIKKIATLEEIELQRIMRAVEQRYAAVHPGWDVVYVAVHKDPQLRKQDFADILRLMGMDLDQSFPMRRM